MTVVDLEESITYDEVIEWVTWFKIKHEAEKKAQQEAKAKRQSSPRRGRRR